MPDWTHLSRSSPLSSSVILIGSEGTTAVPIYHPAFFENHEQFYGLTGTINEDDESNEVKSVYNVGSFNVPTHQACK
jgi:preprotein translocase subunit SecA